MASFCKVGPYWLNLDHVVSARPATPEEAGPESDGIRVYLSDGTPHTFTKPETVAGLRLALDLRCTPTPPPIAVGALTAEDPKSSLEKLADSVPDYVWEGK